jgi:hypothetical protein
MVMILHEPGDASASWLAERFAALGRPADIVTSADLDTAILWDHRIDGDCASVAITLRDGRELSSAAAQPIVNRLSFVPFNAMREEAGRDFGYAVQEMFALYLSWLHAWPAPVINRPTPQGLCGNYRHPSVWTTLGRRAGLPVRPWRQSDRDAPDIAWQWAPAEATAIALGDRVLLPPVLPQAFGDGCVALAGLADTALLGIDFARDGEGRWEMTSASPLPNLMLGGEPAAAMLAAALA